MRVLFIVKFTEPTNQPDQPQKTNFQSLPLKNEAKNKDKKILFLKNFKKKYFLT